MVSNIVLFWGGMTSRLFIFIQQILNLLKRAQTTKQQNIITIEPPNTAMHIIVIFKKDICGICLFYGSIRRFSCIDWNLEKKAGTI